jgi:hypothetical protein
VNATQGWPGLDPTTPNVARMYDYYLGGKDNFEADRAAAEKVLALFPGLRQGVQGNRRFLRRVIRFLAAEAGVTQFLDIGVGLPTQGAVHEIAQEVSPNARVVYVDYDPAGIVAQLRDALAPGSYLAVAHIGTEFFPDKKALARAVKAYQSASEQIHPRTREQILRFFDGWRLLEPGVVPKDDWHPEPTEAEAAPDAPNIQWGAVGRKP